MMPPCILVEPANHILKPCTCHAIEPCTKIFNLTSRFEKVRDFRTLTFSAFPPSPGIEGSVVRFFCRGKVFQETNDAM
jgi:hypothetical protein